MSSWKCLPVASVILILASCGTRTELPDGDASTFDLTEFAEKFEQGSIIGVPRIVECTLSEGASTSCVAVTLPANPETFDIGPWCPTNVADGAELGGIWPEGGQVYDVDGSFIGKPRDVLQRSHMADV